MALKPLESCRLRSVDSNIVTPWPGATNGLTQKSKCTPIRYKMVSGWSRDALSLGMP